MTTLLNIITWCTLIVLTIVAIALVVAAVIAVTYGTHALWVNRHDLSRINDV